SQWYARPRSAGVDGAVVRVALLPEDRSELHRRIDERFDLMIAQGFLDEVRRLRARGDLHPELPSMRAVGYRQLWAHLDGSCALDEAIARGKAATSQYAKRQITWLRGESGLLQIAVGAADAMAQVLCATEVA